MPFFTPKPVATDYRKKFDLDLPRLLAKRLSPLTIGKPLLPPPSPPAGGVLAFPL